MAEYFGYITKLNNIIPHDNADNLKLCVVFNNQVVINKGMNEGDLVFYVPSDMQLSLEFCKENKLLRSMGGYLEDDKRNVKCLKLRGQRSDGLVLPLDSLSKFTDISKLSAGDKIGVLNGVEIVTKYVPKTDEKFETNKNNSNKSLKNETKEKYPLFAEHCDTKQFDFNLNNFKMNDEIIITEKLHGSSGRTGYNLKLVDDRNVIRCALDRLFKKTPKQKKERAYVSGSRRVTFGLSDDFYKSDDWRLVYHNDFKDKNKLNYGEEVYYEIVGFLPIGKSIMPSGDNKKLKDKDFLKRYGEKTIFRYGCDDNKNDIYVYRMTLTTEDGYVIEYPWDLVKLRCEQMGLQTVPELDRFMFTTIEDLVNRVDLLLDRPSVVDNTHVSEGVVVRRNNATNFESFKKKGFYFKSLEGLIKENSPEPDLEESQSIIS